MRVIRSLLVGLLLGLSIVDPAAAQTAADHLRPGDVRRFRIWREPDLSREFPVNEQGEVTLPKLGPLAVDSVHLDSIQPRLVAAYQQDLNNPSVEITVFRRVAVLGAVRNPGLCPVDPMMRVSDVLARSPVSSGSSPAGNPSPPSATSRARTSSAASRSRPISPR